MRKVCLTEIIILQILNTVYYNIQKTQYFFIYIFNKAIQWVTIGSFSLKKSPFLKVVVIFSVNFSGVVRGRLEEKSSD